MGNEVEPMLTEELVTLLQKERFVTIATIDFELTVPNVSAISWIYALNKEKIRFSVDNRSRIIQNIRNNPGVVITLIGNGSTYSITGNATILFEKIEGIKLNLALVEVSIAEVRDVMFYGSQISVDPQYEKTYDSNAAAKLDRQVFEAMKKGV